MTAQVHHVAHGCTRNSSRAGMMGGSSTTRAAATRSIATANRDAAQSDAAVYITATTTSGCCRA